MTEVLGAILLVSVTAFLTLAIARRRLRRMIAATHDVARNTATRVPVASMGGELRELARAVRRSAVRRRA